MNKYLRKSIIDNLSIDGSCVKPIRKVEHSKYERESPEIYKWWIDTFKKMEANRVAKPHNKLCYLEKVFTANEIKKLKKLDLNVVSDEDLSFIENVVKKERLVHKHKKNTLPKDAKIKNNKKNKKCYTNPYLNFMRKSEEDASVWRQKPKKELDTIPLIERARLVQQELVENFMKWFSEVTPTKSEIDENVVLDIFSIIFRYPVAKGLMKDIKPVFGVPEKTARFIGNMKYTKNALLKREIKKDIWASQLEPRLFAFNKTLPEDLMRKPIKEDVTQKWMEGNYKHKDLESMAAVWQDLLGLTTTNKFCEWLFNRPFIRPRPPFLEEQGLLTRHEPNPDILELTEIEIPDFNAEQFNLFKPRKLSEELRYSVTLM